MFLTEYDEARAHAESRADGYEDGFKEGSEEGYKKGLEEGRAEGREEGRAKGREEGRKEGAIKMLLHFVNTGIISLDKAAEEAGITVEEFKNQTGLK